EARRFGGAFSRLLPSLRPLHHFIEIPFPAAHRLARIRLRRAFLHRHHSSAVFLPRLRLGGIHWLVSKCLTHFPTSSMVTMARPLAMVSSRMAVTFRQNRSSGASFSFTARSSMGLIR